VVAEVKRSSLTPETIVDMATTIIEDGGVEALTMRRLAQALGVRTPALYWHIGSRQEILDRLIERLTEDLGSLVLEGRTPAERIIELCRAVLAEVRRRPYIMAVSFTAGRGEAVFIRVQEAIAREVHAAGLRGSEAAFAMRAILYQLGGFLVIDFGVDHEATIRGVDRWELDDPELLDAAREAVDVDEVFGFSLEAVLATLLPN
jgi:AcrR family transcriptional regulator